MAASIVRDINRKVILGLKSKLPSYIECQFYRSISQCTPNSQKSLRYYGQPAPSTHPHLLKKGEVTPGLNYEEYQMRRHKLMESIASYSAKSDPQHDHHLVIIPSASKTFMSEKIPYVFHQNTNFSYTTGFQEPNSALVLHSVPGKLLPFHISTLFVPRRDPHTELWDGPRTGSDRAVELTGVDEAMDFEQLEYFLDMFLSTNNKFTLWYDFSSVPNSDINRIMKHFIKKCRLQSNISFDNPLYLIQQLRVIKSPSEIKLLQQSCNIASDAFSEVMQFSHPNVSEHVLNAKMEFECKLRGAQYLGYPPVVAGGNRANIIHYINNNQWILDDELILMDAGCYYGNYVSDITRTWPVNGRFTSSQLAVYEAVLEVQEELIKLCNVTSSLDSLFSVLCLSIGKKLQQLGIASQNISSADLIQVAQKFCPHHVGHYLGMDVHDTAMISRSAKLKPGMVITIEPGIYINEKNHKVPEKFHGIGIRIEDNILITDSEPVLLTKKCPKSVHDIETLLHSRISQEVTGR